MLELKAVNMVGTETIINVSENDVVEDAITKMMMKVGCRVRFIYQLPDITTMKSLYDEDVKLDKNKKFFEYGMHDGNSYKLSWTADLRTSITSENDWDMLV